MDKVTGPTARGLAGTPDPTLDQRPDQVVDQLTGPRTGRSSAMIDWGFAAAVARTVAPSGPRISREEAQAAVAELKEASRSAYEPVAETSGLHTPSGAAPAIVVDRGGWVDANVRSFQAMFDPVVEKLLARQEASGRPAPPPAMQAFTGKVTGTEVGGLLAFMSTKILGQYDLSPGRPAEDASLLLVAPNIVQVEQELRVDPRDFRLWVALHEETHRVQFTAVPWLRDHMLTRTGEMAASLTPDPEEMIRRVKDVLVNAPRVLQPGSNGLAELFTTREQREELAALTAVMALLEGHADVVMDEVGPRVVPSVDVIRAKFERRRRGLGFFDILVRRLLGLEAKMAQYRDGAAFVRGVQERVGVDGFNAVWTAPATLPSADEISDPGAWVARVHG